MRGVDVYVVLPGDLVPVNKADIHPAPELVVYVGRMLRQHYQLLAGQRGWAFDNGARADWQYVSPLGQTLLGIPAIDPQGQWHPTTSGLAARFPGRYAALCRVPPHRQPDTDAPRAPLRGRPRGRP